jgi:protein gp37
MFREQIRYGRDPEIVVRSKTTFRDPLKWKEPEIIFTCSWSDFFHEAADQWRAEVWDIIRSTPRHTYQILTKRPERIREHLPADWGDGWPHVWLGTSIENQRHAFRANILHDIPAAVRFISAEPLLGPLDLTEAPGEGGLTFNAMYGINWIIVGGESGAGARPMDERWARAIRDQCAHYRIPYFLKQMGGAADPRAHELAVLDGQTYTEMPGIRV